MPSRSGHFLSLGFSFASLVSAVTPGYTLRAEDERGRWHLSFWVWVTSLSVVEVTKGWTSSGRGEIGKGHSAPITQEEQEGFYSENLFRTRENRANKHSAKDH